MRALVGCGNSKVLKSLTEHLRQGERVHILEAGESKPIQVSFVPLRYDELHDSIVPEEIRRVSGYWGYRPGPIHKAQRDGVVTARPHQTGVLLAKLGDRPHPFHELALLQAGREDGKNHFGLPKGYLSNLLQ